VRGCIKSFVFSVKIHYLEHLQEGIAAAIAMVTGQSRDQHQVSLQCLLTSFLNTFTVTLQVSVSCYGVIIDQIETFLANIGEIITALDCNVNFFLFIHLYCVVHNRNTGSLNCSQ